MKYTPGASAGDRSRVFSDEWNSDTTLPPRSVILMYAGLPFTGSVSVKLPWVGLGKMLKSVPVPGVAIPELQSRPL